MHAPAISQRDISSMKGWRCAKVGYLAHLLASAAAGKPAYPTFAKDACPLFSYNLFIQIFHKYLVKIQVHKR